MALPFSNRTPKSITASFEILGLAGRGQYGRVHCARQRSTGQLVALKELPLHRFPTHNLLRELRYLLSLDHANITRCEALIHASEGRFLVLEYCEGGTLRDLLVESVPLSSPQIWSFIHQILAGMEHAHSQGLIHCDIKPENILLQPTASGWCLKLTDFGIARHRQPDHRDHSATGSPAYMAPERFYGEVYPASDLYSVGILLYELLTGHRPFSGSPSQLQHAHLNQAPPLDPDIPLSWRPVVEQALRKLPARRFADVARFRAALEQVGSDLESEAPKCFSLPHPVSLPQVQESYPFPLRADHLRLMPAQECPRSSPMVIWAIETHLYRSPLSQVETDLNRMQPWQILPEPITALCALGCGSDLLLALTQRGLYRIAAELGPERLLDPSATWHHCFSSQTQQLYWVNRQHWGRLDLEILQPEISSASGCDPLLSYRRPLVCKLGDLTPQIQYLSGLEQIAIVHNRCHKPELWIYPSASAELESHPGQVYPLPYPVDQVYSDWQGRSLWLTDRLQPGRITRVRLTPFQISAFWVNAAITQVLAAPWGLAVVTALGRLWCLSAEGLPLAQIEGGAQLQILSLEADGSLWIQTSQVLHTSNRSLILGEASSWILQINLSSLSP